MKENVIRLTESDLHRVIKESVKKVLRENDVMATTKKDNEKWYAVYVMRAGDLERMAEYGYEREEYPCFVELTLVKSTDEDEAGYQGAGKLERRYNRGKVFLSSNALRPVRVRIATQKDFQLWKNGETIFEYDEFEKLG